jgi:hypothetical protein
MLAFELGFMKMAAAAYKPPRPGIKPSHPVQANPAQAYTPRPIEGRDPAAGMVQRPAQSNAVAAGKVQQYGGAGQPPSREQVRGVNTGPGQGAPAAQPATQAPTPALTQQAPIDTPEPQAPAAGQHPAQSPEVAAGGAGWAPSQAEYDELVQWYPEGAEELAKLYPELAAGKVQQHGGAGQPPSREQVRGVTTGPGQGAPAAQPAAQVPATGAPAAQPATQAPTPALTQQGAAKGLLRHPQTPTPDLTGHPPVPNNDVVNPNVVPQTMNAPLPVPQPGPGVAARVGGALGSAAGSVANVASAIPGKLGEMAGGVASTGKGAISAFREGYRAKNPAAAPAAQPAAQQTAPAPAVAGQGVQAPAAQVGQTPPQNDEGGQAWPWYTHPAALTTALTTGIGMYEGAKHSDDSVGGMVMGGLLGAAAGLPTYGAARRGIAGVKRYADSLPQSPAGAAAPGVGAAAQQPASLPSTTPTPAGITWEPALG